VPNLYPVVVSDGPVEPLTLQQHAASTNNDPLQAWGEHEVIIESPDHVGSLTELSTDQMERVCLVYRDRLLRLRHDPRWISALLFKNVGRAAGASVHHTHSQLIALPLVVPAVARELQLGNLTEKKFDTRGGPERDPATPSCRVCAMVDDSLENPVRTVAVGEHLVAVTPFAPRFAYEVWIVPRQHQSAFELSSDALLKELASLLPTLLRAYEHACPSLNYNFYIHSAPFRPDRYDHYHWHLQLFPRTHLWAGFEIGSDLVVNPVSPESAAMILRGAITGSYAC
jgi:UDPglucose--hexose-1-phosphate uridylyltransferase